MQNLRFKTVSTDGKARAGEFIVNNKLVKTPTFMPVATRGAVKGITMDVLSSIDPDVILCNTYHLISRPGTNRIHNNGGLHKYINWDKVILTDSGGFQGWSLGAKRLPEGLLIKSSYDGSELLLTPELAISAQSELGSDIAMILDDLIDPNSSPIQIEDALERTLIWSELALNMHKNKNQSLFGIVQGGVSDIHREYSLNKTIEFNFDGYAIGGLSIGETSSDRNRIVDFCSNSLPKDKPIYVMGLGDINGMLDLISLGVDMFDCVWPTRLARHGKIIDKLDFINLKNNKYEKESVPLVEDCSCITCKNYSRSYLRHLLLNEHVSSWPYLIEHNLHQTKNILDNAREAIILGSFNNYKESLNK